MADLSTLSLNSASEVPLYRQLAEAVTNMIASEAIRPGDRLPATRELAGRLGLNRTTVSAAYALLEESGLIEGHVGRGSYVAGSIKPVPARATDWDAILPPLEMPFRQLPCAAEISFASSRPAEEDFPVEEFRQLSKEVVDSPQATEILQLGAPHGYAPLRRYLLQDAARRGIARASDDLIITNGCQQALDLLARVFASEGKSVLVEDPAYHGLLRVFSRAGMSMIPVPVDDAGVDVDALEKLAHEQRARLLVVTPAFQNPTGATITLERRKRIVELARRLGLVLVENDIYSELRYEGSPLPTLKQLDESGNTILLRSYSKVSFPGLRVGWVIAPARVVAHLAEAKQISDLHSDQLSQAVLLRFVESGALAQHLERTRRSGAARLRALLRACARYLPPATHYTRPQGGMNLWMELPAPLSSEQVLSRAQEQGVTFLPGRYFSSGRVHGRGLRISFGGLPPEQITRGIQILGEVAAAELAASTADANFQPAAALV